MSPLWRRVARVSHRLCERVIVNSRAAFEEELAAGLAPALLAHIPNGVDPQDLPAIDDRRLGAVPRPLVVSVAHLQPEKGHRHLLEAWRRVVDQMPGAHLALLGDGPLRSALECQVVELGLDRDVTFLGFTEPRSWLEAADTCVLASLTEGMPSVVLEAMLSGCPVVASRVGGIGELVVECETGLLVPPGDAPALAAAVLRLLGDASLRAALATAGRQRALDRFSAGQMVRATEAVYASVLAAGPATGGNGRLSNL